MTHKRVTDLTENTTPVADDLLYLVDSAGLTASQKVKVSTLLPYYNSTAAEVAAGITPTDYTYEPGDVRRYGAVADGGSGDAAVNATAFQEAIDVGQDVYVPVGTFYLDTTLTIVTDGQKFYGEDRHLTVLRFIDVSAFTVTAPRIVMHSMKIILDDQQKDIDCIVHNDATNRRFDNHYYNIWFVSWSTCIDAWGHSQSNYHDNYFQNSEKGIKFIEQCVNNIVYANMFDCGTACIEFTFVTENAEGVRISDNTLYCDDTGYAIRGTGANFLQIDNNLMDHGGAGGVRLTDCNRAVIRGNYISIEPSATARGIWLEDTDVNDIPSIISNNWVECNGGTIHTGIEVESTYTGTIVTGNTVRDTVNYDIRVECSDSIVANNVCLTAAPADNISLSAAGQYFGNYVASSIGASGTDTLQLINYTLAEKVSNTWTGGAHATLRDFTGTTTAAEALQLLETLVEQLKTQGIIN